MLRILHSLPRTHKLLLLPVATMVTVLGAQKLITTYHDLNQPQTPLESVLVPLPSDSAPGVPSLRQERAPVAEAIDRASRALDATREHIPLSELAATEIVDLDVIISAEASMASEAEPRDAQSQVALHEGALDDGALHMAIVLGTITSGSMSTTPSKSLMPLLTRIMGSNSTRTMSRSWNWSWQPKSRSFLSGKLISSSLARRLPC